MSASLVWFRTIRGLLTIPLCTQPSRQAARRRWGGAVFCCCATEFGVRKVL